MESWKQLNISLRQKNLLAFLCLSVFILVSYSNSFQASWHLDDELNITDNHRLHLSELSLSGIGDALLSTPPRNIAFFRPISRLSLALNYYLGGKEVFGFHVVNLLIHIAASIFLYLFILTTLNMPMLKTQYGPHSFILALLSALLWAVHPIQTQAVTYVVQRMASMTGMFFIMAMYFYARAGLTTGRSTKGILYTLSAACGLLAFGSKENAIMLPVVLFFFHILLVEGLNRNTWKRNLKILCLFYLLPLAAGFLYLQLFHDFGTRVFGLYESRTFTLLERMLTEPRAIVFYMSLLLYPTPNRFSIDHEFTVSKSLFDPPTTAFSILFLIALLILAGYSARKRPLVSFPLLFFFLNHIPESSILPMELLFEHRNYLPSMLFFVPVADTILHAVFHLTSRRMRVIMAASTILILIALSHSTFLRNAVWKDEKSLWQDVLVKYPDSFRAHNNLGRYNALGGETEKAKQAYLQALEADQTQRRTEKAITLFNLGYIEHLEGDSDSALSFYRMALELDPCCPRANNNLAALLLETVPLESGEPFRLLEKALECGHGSELPRALSNIGMLFMRMGRNGEATDALRRSLRMEPGNQVTRLRLGYVLKENGSLDEALMHFSRIPDPSLNIPSLLLTAEVHLLSGRTHKARRILESLLEMAPRPELMRFLQDSDERRNGMTVIPHLSLLLPKMAEICNEKGPAFDEIRYWCLKAQGE